MDDPLSPKGIFAGIVIAVGLLANVVTLIASIADESFVDGIATAGTIAGLVFGLSTTALVVWVLVIELSWALRALGIVVGLGGTAVCLFLVILPWDETLLQIMGAVFVVVGAWPLGAFALGTYQDHQRLRHKECPNCAETVKKEAKVCRFCGYRFEVRRSAP